MANDKAIARAYEAHRTGRHADALLALLDAWDRYGFWHNVAQAIEATAARVPCEPLQGEEWFALAEGRDPVDLGRLLPHALDPPASASTARLEALARWPLDPRLGSWIVESIEALPFRRNRDWWRAMLRLARRRVRNCELRERVLAWRETLSGFVPTDELEPLVNELTMRPRVRIMPPSSLSRQLLKRMIDGEEIDTDAPVEALLARVLEHPHDDGARQIYGDALTDARVPRAELIRLQYIDRPTKQQKAKMKQLIDEHWRAWIGGLGPVILKSDLAFEAGFLARAKVPERREAALIRAALDDPHWRTIERLEAPALVFTSPQLVSLRHATAAGHWDWPGQPELAIETLVVPGPRAENSGERTRPHRRDLARLQDGRLLPALRELSLGLRRMHSGYGPQRWFTVLDGALPARLEKLTLRVYDAEDAVGWVGAIAERKLRCVELHVSGMVRLTIEGDRLTFSRLRGGPLLDTRPMATRILRTLPARLVGELTIDKSLAPLSVALRNAATRYKRLRALSLPPDRGSRSR